MKALIVLVLICSTARGQRKLTRDITTELDVYASLRPFLLAECIVQCAGSTSCKSVLLEEKTKTCFLNRNIAKTHLIGINGFQYSEKYDPAKPQQFVCEFQIYLFIYKGHLPDTKPLTSPSHTEIATPQTAMTTSGTKLTPGTTTASSTNPTTTSKTMSVLITSGKTATSTTSSTTPSTTEPPPLGTTLSNFDTKIEQLTTTHQYCPPNYGEISKFYPPICYRIEMTTPSPFQVAKTVCEAEHAILLLPDSRERLDAVKKVIYTAAKGITSPHMIWIDARRSSAQGTWKTSDHSDFDYDEFLRTQWDDQKTGDCAGMKFTPPRNISGWIATDCSLPAWYICTPSGTYDQWSSYYTYG
ncbi:uncharacterized protein LOC132543383 [Ylistrum balloti]|uniref:uncharacterized protein LOC132543383 n=1 Tax=Ylistrum balloti TaxID=509963 RepID=UPI002905AF56|nr:uncharacterized protein LOC132543383 [Ylistrum balloti]